MSNSNKILTFEWNEKLETLEIHGNCEGLYFLSNILNKLTQISTIEHTHLMTPEWGRK